MAVRAVLMGISACIVGILLVLVPPWTLLNTTAIVSFGVAGFCLGAASILCSGKNFYPANNDTKTVANVLLTKMMGIHKTFTPCKRTTVTTLNLDMAIQEIMDLTTKDYILSWYKDLGIDQERFVHMSQDEMWEVFKALADRLQNIDIVPFMTRDVVNIWCRHFQKIRMTSKKTESGPTQLKFHLHKWIHSDSREEEHLRKVAETLLVYLLPKNYSRCIPARQLFREILSCSLLKPTIDLLCDPDYINQKIHGWLDYRQRIAAEHKRTYTYAATYEDFMKMIEQCSDIEHLRQMRYNIIAEIMQSTTIQNLKRAKGLDVDKESAPKGNTKGDLLRARNLKRYINQLTVTKSYCEKRLYLLGGPDYKSYTQDGQQNEEENLPGKKILAFSVIMETADARNQFMAYLKRVEEDMLLKFWISVEGMRLSNQRHWHTQAGEIYQMFISHSTSIIRNYLERSTIRAMEAFMIGNKGPDAFWEAQNQVFQLLEEQHYPSFILSDIYHKYLRTMEEGTVGSSSSSTRNESRVSPRISVSGSSIPEDPKSTVRIAEHSTYAQTRLSDLNEKILNKTQAVHALRYSQKPDSKMKKLQEDIENEIHKFKSLRRELEFHIDRTDLWLSNLGRWKGHIYNAEIVKEDDKMVPYFVIVVDLHVGSSTHAHSSKNPQGWVVSRNLDEFAALHQKLIQIDPSLKSTRLPTISKFRVKSLDTEFLNKAKETLQSYITEIMSGEGLSHSEAMFAFLSPSPEYLKQTDAKTGKSKSSDKGAQESDSDDELLFGDEENHVSIKRKDSIAGPLYRLIMEVFEMRGAAKFLRRTLMVFVQVTFGRSTDKQLRETVNWMYSEPMMIYYLNLFRESFWPDGELTKSQEPRSDEEKLHMRMMAKEKILENIPEVVINLVGEQNARKGMVKMFESFQDTRLNKQLFYDILESFMFETFPELVDIRREIVKERESAAKESSAESEGEEDERTHAPRRRNDYRSARGFWMMI